MFFLNKALYGLRQAGRTWHARLEKELITSNADSCVHHLDPDNNRTFIIVYIDDILLMSRNQTKIEKLKDYLSTKLKN